MDIHPIIVHFPVALLTFYSVFELIRFERVLSKPYWFFIKAVLVIFGELGAIVAFMTGPEEGGGALIDMHERFAIMTLIIFGIISLHYLLRWLRHEGYHLRLPTLPSFLLVTLALAGLFAITITGGLGGALVYGTHFDPFMAPVFKFLGVY
ncbi:hypothetical protein KW790_02665 [Candidatus Parcubacteria bacterium]|nr:hypothetical protein [Candidatus Parcubacteria bacterium]